MIYTHVFHRGGRTVNSPADALQQIDDGILLVEIRTVGDRKDIYE